MLDYISSDSMPINSKWKDVDQMGIPLVRLVLEIRLSFNFFFHINEGLDLYLYLGLTNWMEPEPCENAFWQI